MKIDLWHGTNQTFDAFDAKMLGFHTSNEASAAAFFFAMHKDTAVEYALGAARKLLPNHQEHEARIAQMVEDANAALKRRDHDRYEKLIMEAEELESEAINAAPAGARILRCRVSFSNPLEIDGLSDAAVKDFGKVLRDARRDGYDAVIMTDVVDTPSGLGPVDTHIAVFSSDQIEILHVLLENQFQDVEPDDVMHEEMCM